MTEGFSAMVDGDGMVMVAVDCESALLKTV